VVVVVVVAAAVVVVLGHNLEHGATVSAVSYVEIMRSKLKPAIRNNRRGLLSRGVRLLYDNALTPLRSSCL
jgi:hypothetical protein